MKEQTHISIGDIFTALVTGLPVAFGIVLIACKWSGLIACSAHAVAKYWLGLLLIGLVLVAASIVLNGVLGLLSLVLGALKGGDTND